ncbi:hypothetical protein EYF80_051655 [Liparis tanakae]|uniref:Uncharacterized protein n=1 Tax=Liparis tanakae TaxID=230148 RepID=A0A4Z2FAM4_9TELE|nr:hypothetical protein EYF80_051655 [Liparis tanakae]
MNGGEEPENQLPDIMRRSGEEVKTFLWSVTKEIMEVDDNKQCPPTGTLMNNLVCSQNETCLSS